jgi:hypothetical protein
MYPTFFNVKPMDKASEKHLTGVGLEDWRVSGEAKAASFTENIQGFTRDYVPRVWKSGFQVTREMVDDDLKYHRGRKMAKCWNTIKLLVLTREKSNGYNNSQSAAKAWMVSWGT